MLRTILHTEKVLVAGCAVGPFAMNQYLVACVNTNKAALVDCGSLQPQNFLDFAKSHNFVVDRILETHGHIDHVAGLAKTRQLLAKAPIYLHRGDLEAYTLAPEMGKRYGLSCPAPPEPDVFVEDGDVIEVGDLKFEVMHTPGHSAGHVCFHEDALDLLFCGDLLFKGSVGRTDLPGANTAAMTTSLLKVMELNDDVTCFPGHMQTTTIGHERKYNMYVEMVLDGVSKL
eukprot:m.13902 g.13902  ORF g.13902 m.13902 type:complete len:229 (-) comp9905_c0_seq1:81-767(-)